MLELLVIATGFLVLKRALGTLDTMPTGTLAPKRLSARLAQLSDYADRLYTERKWLAAEKAYLAVLKLDHKNVTAYSHLGIIYSTQKNMADAIECFQIAARLKPSGPTLQNLALAFFDNRNYMKAVLAYEKAITFEPTAQRYVGLSKAQQKLSNDQAAVAALERAAALDASPRIIQLLADARAQASGA